MCLDVAMTLAEAFPDRIRVPDLLPALQGAGLLGRKVGRGIYRYRKGGEAKPNRTAAKLRPPRASKAPPREEIENRLVLLMINEASRCLEEGIVASAGEIDLAMVMGTGFAPFRGGPLRCADSMAIAKVTDDMNRLAQSAGPHYAPSDLLRDMAKTGRRFYEDQGAERRKAKGERRCRWQSRCAGFVSCRSRRFGGAKEISRWWSMRNERVTTGTAITKRMRPGRVLPRIMD